MKAKELCPICGGELEEREIKEEIWLGGELLVIESVHAKVCERCGEKIVSYDEKYSSKPVPLFLLLLLTKLLERKNRLEKFLYSKEE